MKLVVALSALALACKSEPVKPAPVPAPVATPSVSSAPVLESLPPPPAAVDAATEATSVTWEVLPSLDGLAGRWVGVTAGDAIPQGPTGGKIVPGGVRLDIVEKRPGSVTPWNLTAWVPKEGHMKADTINIGCGFYPDLHDGEWRVAYCKGYGLPGPKSKEQRLVLKKSGEKLQVKVGDLFEVEVKKP